MQEQSDEKVHEEAEPYHEPGFAKSVDLDKAVVDDVAYWKYSHAGGHGDDAERHGLDFYQIGDDEAHTEEHRQQKEGERETLFGQFFHDSCF